MTNVAEFTHRMLGRGDYCICEIRPFGSLLQAWTAHDLDEVLDQKRHPHFLRPMHENCLPRRHNRNLPDAEGGDGEAGRRARS